VALVALGFWVYAESRLARTWRLGMGIVAIVVTGFACYRIASFVPELESFRHRRAMKKVEESLAAGDTQRVQQAVQTYNSIAATGSTYQASSAMSELLSHEHK
jgi:hypothetical protein